MCLKYIIFNLGNITMGWRRQKKRKQHFGMDMFRKKKKKIQKRNGSINYEVKKTWLIYIYIYIKAKYNYINLRKLKSLTYLLILFFIFFSFLVFFWVRECISFLIWHHNNLIYSKSYKWVSHKLNFNKIEIEVNLKASQVCFEAKIRIFLL